MAKALSGTMPKPPDGGAKPRNRAMPPPGRRWKKPASDDFEGHSADGSSGNSAGDTGVNRRMHRREALDKLTRQSDAQNSIVTDMDDSGKSP